MEVDEVLESLVKAKQRRQIDNPLVIHSNRGVQFVSKKYNELTAYTHRSYSRKGNPWDNACIESFHSLIKREWLNGKTIQNYESACSLIFEYIETFYNTVRSHSHCMFQSPNQYEQQFNSGKSLN